MRLTKFGHACIRLEHQGVRIVVDPGVFTGAEAVEGADAVFITHEHPDHYDPEKLRATDARIYTIDAVAAQIRSEHPDLAERVTDAAPGAELDVGLPVSVVGEMHAVIHPDYPRIHNSGYVFDLGGTSIYHPGDALTPPGREIDVLCAPISAPWLKMSEAIDFVREIGAPRSLGIHDAIYTDVALGMVDSHMGNLLPETLKFTRLAAGEDLE